MHILNHNIIKNKIKIQNNIWAIWLKIQIFKNLHNKTIIFLIIVEIKI